jgi:hypothetical protein
VGFGCGFSTAGQSSAHTARTAYPGNAEERRRRPCQDGRQDKKWRATRMMMEVDGDGGVG